MGMSGRQARRLMERMGMQMEELSNVVQVIIRTSTREITIAQPTVTLTRTQGQNIYQVMGGEVTEGGIDATKVDIPEEDIHLVAQQANVTLEIARKTLEDTKGDLAQAIMLLAQRRTG